MPNSLPPAQTYKRWIFQVDQTELNEFKVAFWRPDGRPLTLSDTFPTIDTAQAWAFQYIDQDWERPLSMSAAISCIDRCFALGRAPWAKTVVVSQNPTIFTSQSDLKGERSG